MADHDSDAPARLMFPIMDGHQVHCIPWDIIARCEKRAIRNHDQTLKRLAERGGLCAAEALLVLTDRCVSQMKYATSVEEDEAELLAIIDKIERGIHV
jgi:hypothetical protein